MPNPIFHIEGSGRSKRYKYIGTTEGIPLEGDHNYSSFAPVSVYVSSNVRGRNLHNVRILSPCMCYRRDASDGNIYIVLHLST